MAIRAGAPGRRSAAAGCRPTAAPAAGPPAREQRDAHAGGHHLAQGLEAGGPEPAALGRARRAGTPSSAWSRRQWPSSSSSTCSSASTDEVDRLVGAGQRVVGRHGQHEVLGEEELLRASRSSWTGQGEDRRVEPAVAQLLRARPRSSPRPAAARGSGTGRGACGTTWGSRYGASVGNRPMRTRARLGVLGLAGDAADVVGLVEHRPGPARRPARPASVSMTWPGLRSTSSTPSSLLELLELGRQRRLADEAGLGGPAEVAVVGHGHQVPEIAQVHGRRCSRPPASATAGRAARHATPMRAAAASAGRRGADQVVEGAQRGGRPGAHGDDDLLVRHGRAVAGGEHAGHRGRGRGRRSRSRRGSTARPRPPATRCWAAGRSARRCRRGRAGARSPVVRSS